MEVIHLTHSEKPVKCESHVMAIGFFDGVHLGHQELLNEARSLAERKGCKFSVMTFSPHPNEVTKKDKNRKYLMTLSQKIEKMEKLGVDKLFITKFDLKFASLQPTEFIQRFIKDINACHVVVGFDFTFGFKAQGNTELLQRESMTMDYDVSVMAKKTCSEGKISSTLIRSLVKNGEFSSISDYLGEHYKINAKVLPGQRRNHYVVHPDYKSILPSSGSYRIRIKAGSRRWSGKLTRYSNLYRGIELETLDSFEGTISECEITFIEKIKKVKEVPIKSMEEIVYG